MNRITFTGLLWLLTVSQSDAQTVPVENSLLYFGALKQANVLAEMHLYHDGGQGLGMSKANPPNASWGQWKAHLLDWLASRGLWQPKWKVC